MGNVIFTAQRVPRENEQGKQIGWQVFYHHTQQLGGPFWADTHEGLVASSDYVLGWNSAVKAIADQLSETVVQVFGKKHV
jgi:hypothetical protein